MGLQLCFVDFHELNIVKLSFTYMSRDEELFKRTWLLAYVQFPYISANV